LCNKYNIFLLQVQVFFEKKLFVPGGVMRIGERVLLTAKIKGITQKEIAEKLRIKQSAVSLWGKDGRNLPATRLPEIAKILGVTVGFLTGEEDGGGDLRELRDIPAAEQGEAVPTNADLMGIIKSQQSIIATQSDTIASLSRTIESHGKKK
jgi:transcriptional regulator with XRE-family HTH domain